MKLGIIAGNGRFPVIIAEAAKKNDCNIVAVAHTGLTEQSIEDFADKTFWIKLGQLSELIDILRRERVGEAVMAGGVSKRFMFKGMIPDPRALALLSGLRDKKDDTILRAIAGELEKEGIKVSTATSYVKTMLAEKDILTRTGPTAQEMEDIHFGITMAREIGRLDIGQCVIVKNQAVTAVEAVEGTDEAIIRGGRLANGGAVVIKVCKPDQDTRFDLPTVGPATIASMAEVKARVLAIEAGLTVIIDRQKMLESAEEAGIAVVGI